MGKLPIQERLRSADASDFPLSADHLCEEAAEVIGELVEVLSEARVVVEAARDLAGDCLGRVSHASASLNRNSERLRKIDAILAKVRT